MHLFVRSHCVSRSLKFIDGATCTECCHASLWFWCPHSRSPNPLTLGASAGFLLVYFQVVLGKPLSRDHDTRMDVVYSEPFKPHIVWEAGNAVKSEGIFVF